MDVQSAMNELVATWSDDGGDYRSVFINPFNAEVQLEALSDALYFIEKETKDAKLGGPLAIKRPGCNQTACSNLLESPFSQSSKAHIQKNIETFQVMMKGAAGLGFDDLLVNVGAGYLVGEFDALIDQALAILSSDDETFFSQLEALEQVVMPASV